MSKIAKRYTLEYQVWSWMMTRCYNPNSTMYKYYGGKGIKTCKAWRKFDNFLKDMGKVPNNYTLERLNPNKDYCKKNCKWVSWHVQRRSKTNNNYISFQGYKYVETDWCYALGFKKGGSIYRRLKRGWNLERTLLTTSAGLLTDIHTVVKQLEYNMKNEVYFCKKTKQFKKFPTMNWEAKYDISRSY